MVLHWLHKIWNNTLNSVFFGIATMAAIGIYIAVGSGMASVREYFEMNELQFFSAWPLVILMILLVLNLTTVTLVRIPFTPPRWGVWCVHTGIVTLIFGMFSYYSLKTEGLMLIPVKATAEHYYDSYERALFTRAGDRQALPVPLPDLPRFDSYPHESTQVASSGSQLTLPRSTAPQATGLTKKSLRDLKPKFMFAQNNEVTEKSLGQELGLSVEPSIDIIGYHPYADITTEFTEAIDGQSGRVGIRLKMTDDANQRTAEAWLMQSSDGVGHSVLFETMFEHREAADEAALAKLVDSATKLHRLDMLINGKPLTQYVEVGKSYTLADSGYSIQVESYLPNWRTMQGETVDLLTFMVNAPTTKFRRQVIPGRSVATDWKLDEPGAGPMGSRQTKSLDENFRTIYTFTDPNRLLPQGPSEKRTLVTVGEKIVMITAGKDRAAEVTEFANGRGEVEVIQMPRRGPFQPKLTPQEIAEMPRVKVAFERRPNVLRIDRVVDVPKAKRDRDEGSTGRKQVVTVRVKAGDWSTIVNVPFTQWAAESNLVRWEGSAIQIPGASKPLHLQLGNSLHAMPARVTVENFDLVPYAGGQKAAGSMMRDFKSTLRVVDTDTGSEFTDVAHMNHPVYIYKKSRFFLPSESWLLFQAQWDPNGQKWTVLGVGNRPGVFTMTLGSILIGVGLLYAFYVKPIIVARMKRRAILEASEKLNTKKRRSEEVEEKKVVEV